MATVIKGVPIEFFHFKSKQDVEALLIFSDSNGCEYEGYGLFYIDDILLRFNIGDYIAKIGSRFFALTEEEFESL